MSTNGTRLTRTQAWVLALTSAASLMVSLDTQVVATALPVIRLQLHASLAELEWTVNAYTLTFAVLLLTGAALGDRFGRRRLMIIGITVFTAGSAASALAPGIGDIPRTGGRDSRDPRIEQGYIHAGPVGAGHFVKMIHNGIEYGLMQAYAEGFDILKNANIDALPADHRFDFDIADIAEVWRRGSVIPSWLLDLTASALAENQTLDNYSGFVEDSGEGRWTVNAAIDEAVPAEVLTAALFARFRSRKDHTFAEKILSAMRAGFGGHREPPAKPKS